MQRQGGSARAPAASRCRYVAPTDFQLGSILVDVLADDHLQHSLVAQSPLGGLLAQLVDQVLLEHDRGRQGLADRPEPARCPDVLSESALVELLDLEVALTGLPLSYLR